MTGFSFFVKPCPACGRGSRIALSYLGKSVSCRHCSCVFMANDTESQSEAMNDTIDYWINFSETETSDTCSEKFEPRLPR